MIIGGTHVATEFPNMKQLPNEREMIAKVTHIPVNVDKLSDLESGKSVLSAIQKRSEDVVVFCSANSVYDDLGSERLSICVATSRLPVSVQTLREDPVPATVNKHRWLADRTHVCAR